MIPLSAPHWHLAVLIVHLSLVLAVTVYYAVRRYRWTPRSRAAPTVFRCAVCGHVYLDRRNVPMSECEKCGNMNESIKGF